MTRRLAAISLAVIVPLGFFSKFYSGPLSNWANNSLGGVFYEIFWCLLILFILCDRARPGVVAVAVFGVTCALEVLQLWHPPLLEQLRSTFVGVTILGNHFSWSDFPYYALGSAIGWMWVRAIQQKTIQQVP